MVGLLVAVHPDLCANQLLLVPYSHRGANPAPVNRSVQPEYPDSPVSGLSVPTWGVTGPGELGGLACSRGGGCGWSLMEVAFRPRNMVYCS